MRRRRRDAASELAAARDALRVEQHLLASRSSDRTREGWAQPLRYDASGFPVAPRVPGFSERVRRLLESDH